MKTYFDKSVFTTISEYQVKEIEKIEAAAAEMNKFWPAKPVYSGHESEKDGSIIFERAEILLEHPFLNITAAPPYNSQPRYHWKFFCNSFDQFSKLNSYEREINTPEPNNVKALSTNKIKAWLNYYELKYKELSERNEKNTSTILQFLKSLEGLNVDWYGKNKNGENNRGEIVKNGIAFNFEIGSGQIYTKIEIHYKTEQDLETFLKLSDNKFNS